MRNGVEVHRDIDRIAGEWEQFSLAQKGVSPFARPGWLKAWSRAFGRDALVVYTVRRGGELCGILPVLRNRSGFVAPANWHTPLFQPLLADQDASDALIAVLDADKPSYLELTFLDGNDPAVESLTSSMRSSGYRVAETLKNRSLYLALSSDHESVLSKKRQRELRRRERRLCELGEVSYELHDGSEHLQLLLDEGFRVEEIGWKGAGGTAILSSPATTGFYTDVARWGAETGLLRLGFLRLSGRAIAFDLSLQDGEAHYLLKGGFDHEFHTYAPGVLLRERSIAQAASEGVGRYEFLGTPNPIKREWTDTAHDRLTVQAFRNSATGRCAELILLHGKRYGRRLRQRGSQVGDLVG